MWGNVRTIFDIGLILSHFWANIRLMLSHFGLCAGLYLVSVSLSFGSMQGVCKKYSKHKEKQRVLAVLLMFLMLCLTMFARYFCGVAVAFEWYFLVVYGWSLAGGCLGGGGGGGMACCELS